MYIEEIRREYGAWFKQEIVVDKKRFIVNGGFSFHEKNKIIQSTEFKAFIEEFEKKVRALAPDNHIISNEDFNAFKAEPCFGGNSNIIDDLDFMIIREREKEFDVVIEIFAKLETEPDLR